MLKHLPVFVFSFFFFTAAAQEKMLPVEQLTNNADHGWKVVQKWIDSAKNKVEVLPVDTTKRKEAIYNTQVTTGSPMGAIIYFTGGILVDNGWIRILGSGNSKLKRSIPDWNKGKTFKEFGEQPGFLLIADDVLGGFFAINAWQLNKDEPAGMIYYLSPDRLVWEPLDLTYSDFLVFCFSGDLAKFYGDMRWTNWEKDVSKLSPDKVFNFSPPLWSKEGKDITKNKRKAMLVEEQYQFNMEARKNLNLDK